MARRNPSSTMALLQKASTQLRGERVKDKKDTDEDDIQAYLSSISKKTSDQQKKSTKFEDMGDISISTSEDTAPKIPAASKIVNNKFLKKKVPSTDEKLSYSQKQQIPENQFMRNSPGKTTAPMQKQPDVNVFNIKRGTHASKALNKAEALTNRITERAGNVGKSLARLETESDDSLSTSRDKSRLKSISEDSLKKDGRKFMKKVQEVVPLQEELPQRPSTPVRHAVRDHKYLTSRSFTSEDESLAGFIDEFSRSEISSPKRSPRRSPQPQRHGRSSPMSPISRTSTPDSKPPRSPSPSFSPLVSQRPSSPKRWSPGQRSLRKSLSDSSIASDSFASDITDGSLDEGFQINVMDIDALGPIADTENFDHQKSETKSPKTKQHKDQKTFKALSREEKQSIFKSKGKETKKTKNRSKKSNLFSSFGVQTVDDLYSKSSDQDKHVSESSVISEIKTERSSTRFAYKRRGDSLSEVASVPNEYSPRSYSEDFEDSISERIGVSTDTNKQQTSGSEIRTQYSKEDTGKEYTDDFVSEDETIATETYSTRRSSQSSYYDSTYSDTETFTRSSEWSRSRRPGTQDIEVQTEGGLLLSGNQYGGFAMQSPAYGLGFVDPTPIATHVVSADALEALTAYSPAMIALHDMLRMQLDLTNQFIQSQKMMYSSYVDNIESNFRYTSLESTKKYIEKHRKPKLTFKEALKKVSKEMKSS